MAPMLIVVPNVGMVMDDGRVFMDAKAAAGLFLYARFWPGRVRCLSRHTDLAKIGFGRWYDQAELPFECVEIPAGANASVVARYCAEGQIVLAGADSYLDLGLVEALPDRPVVMTIEYTLGTRLAILNLEKIKPWQKLKSTVWTVKTELKRRKELARAAGIQANGTPAFAAYGDDSGKSLCYFDTRLRQSDYIGHEQGAIKAASVLQGAPLRLVFSGRLEAMKGADDLIILAERLVARGNMHFTLDIFGKGSRAAAMQERIDRAGLKEIVRLHEPLDFDAGWVPMMKSDADLFICCHPQSDPSCTYLEVLGCGVPIVGYNNEAFTGVLELGECGLAVPIGNVNLLTDLVEKLDKDRALLAQLAKGAVSVSENRLFEDVFAKRTDHLGEILARG